LLKNYHFVRFGDDPHIFCQVPSLNDRAKYVMITAEGAVIIPIEAPCDFFAFGENAHGG
jgi:hypothetical protein